MVYKIFLLVWIIVGLGYLVMILGFISRGMRSKRIHKLEKMLANNIKRTPQRIREEIRSLLQDILLTKVKRVYKEEFEQTVPISRVRCNSCPDLEIYRNKTSPQLRSRKRAFSESAQKISELNRIQSDTELERIDKKLTFQFSSGLVDQSDLLLRVVNALDQCATSIEQSTNELRAGVEGFSDAEILASEKYDSAWSFGSRKLSSISRMFRERSKSEVKLSGVGSDDSMFHNTWYGISANENFSEFQKHIAKSRFRTMSVPVAQPQRVPGLFTRIKNTLKFKKSDKSLDIERQDSIYDVKSRKSIIDDCDGYLTQTSIGRLSTPTEKYLQQTEMGRQSNVTANDPVLEQTSVAELFRVLNSVIEPDNKNVPKRKFGTASLTPPSTIGTPPRTRRLPIRPIFQRRRSSVNAPRASTNRRFSEQIGSVPPNLPQITITRELDRSGRFSLKPMPTFGSSGPTKRKISHTKEKQDRRTSK